MRRYDPETVTLGTADNMMAHTEMAEYEHGDWVRYEDHEAERDGWRRSLSRVRTALILLAALTVANAVALVLVATREDQGAPLWARRILAAEVAHNGGEIRGLKARVAEIEEYVSGGPWYRWDDWPERAPEGGGR